MSVSPLSGPLGTPVFPLPPTQNYYPSADFSGLDQYSTNPPDTSAPPGTGICYEDPRFGGCYVTELPNKKPARLFVPGNELKFAEEGLKKAYAASYMIETKTGLGSGIGVLSIQQQDGTFLNLILTNRHVVTNAQGGVESPLVATSLWTGAISQGVVLNVLPDNQPDMALVAITTRAPMFTIPIADSSQIAFAQKVYAIGNPLGLVGSITAGVISHPNRPDLGGENVGGRIIQFDAPISPGNSGGPLITVDGRLIGINTFTIPGGPQSPAQNINFAFPADIGFKLLMESWQQQQQQLRPAA